MRGPFGSDTNRGRLNSRPAGPICAFGERVKLTPSALARASELHLRILSQYAFQGNRERYWNYLAAQGVAYAQLALGVVRNDSLNGFVANFYAAHRAEKLGVTLDERQWNDLGIELMRKDFQYRKGFATRPDTQDYVLNLPVQYIYEYHAATFRQFGLDEKAWTAYVPLAPYIKSGDYQEAEAIWTIMMDINFFRQVGGSVWADNKGASSTDWTDHAEWFFVVSNATLAYGDNPWQEFSNPDKIGDWYYAGGQWYRFNVPLGQERIANPRRKAELDRARAFRLERQKFLKEHPVTPSDQSRTIESR
ncbi:hypothetical protein [Massilia horti]|uniref:Uncharacterized protein n=1 Tax=Massilia horti TaxID=2562153 RepID=A0A4Y9T821_9BURK|nr:hypothetical protein [Massilia horti]TFW33649.1 hypothetical protein E4O92_06555 [Massilia horti]